MLYHVVRATNQSNGRKLMPKLSLKSTGTKPARSTRKSTVKRTATKPAARKTAAKTTKAATTKRTTRKVAPAEEEVIDRRTARGKVDPDVLKRYEDALVAVGDRMDAAQAERNEALEEAYEVTQSALADGVPMALVHELTRISRQWLYNMGKHQERGGSVTEGRRNGSKPKRKTSVAKKTGTTARKPAAAKAKTTARKPAAKSGGGAKLKLKSR
jgi:hypothetical protein